MSVYLYPCVHRQGTSLERQFLVNVCLNNLPVGGALYILQNHIVNLQNVIGHCNELLSYVTLQLIYVIDTGSDAEVNDGGGMCDVLLGQLVRIGEKLIGPMKQGD